MRFYDYRCEKCNEVVTVQCDINHIPKSIVCKSCGGSMKKLLSSTPIIYKCDGFYSTDYKDK